MAAGHNHNGMVLYGDHKESNRACTNLHDLARFNGGQMTGWKPLRHHMDNISKALLQFLDKDRAKYTTVQEAGMISLKGLLKSDIPQNPQSTVAALEKVFFEGLLQGRVNASVINLKGTRDGETYFTQDRVPRTPFATIRVHDFNDYRNQPKERRVHIVSSLVYEMCYAFLLIYGCDGRQCATRDSVANGISFTGHGPIWVRIADEAENNFHAFICPMIMPGFDFPSPLGIPQAVKEERDYRKKWFYNTGSEVIDTKLAEVTRSSLVGSANREEYAFHGASSSGMEEDAAMYPPKYFGQVFRTRTNTAILMRPQYFPRSNASTVASPLCESNRKKDHVGLAIPELVLNAKPPERPPLLIITSSRRYHCVASDVNLRSLGINYVRAEATGVFQTTSSNHTVRLQTGDWKAMAIVSPAPDEFS